MADTKGTKQNAKQEVEQRIDQKAEQEDQHDGSSSSTEESKKLILYADIMGFKERVRANSHEEVKKDLELFKGLWENHWWKYFKEKDNIQFVQYSDSILIVENEINADGLYRISRAAGILMEVALYSKFPIKGCIAYGKLTFDKEAELYFGQPLIDAYLLHDELYYYGIVVHHSAEKVVNWYNSENAPYIYSEIPLKKGRTTHCHLAWNIFANSESPIQLDDTKYCEDYLKKIEETVSGAPRIYVDNTRKVLRNDREIWLDAKMVAGNNYAKFPIRED